MSLLQLHRVDFSIGGPLLLEQVDFSLQARERICIVGRNGEGKSTLLKLIAGELKPDDGEIRRQNGLTVAKMAQEVPADTQGSLFDVVAAGLGEPGQLIARYHQLLAAGNLVALGEVQMRIEALNGWDLNRQVEQVLERLGLPGELDFAALSGGMKRRTLLAQALVSKPDVLLLDEPTNHLDIASIAELERLLLQFEGSILFITHDRDFLRALATRIVEIDRGQLSDWPGDYDNYLRRREERAHAEIQTNALFDQRLAQEEAWIRQGIKARRTRNEGRVRALEAMRREHAARRSKPGTAKIITAAAKNSGKKVLEARSIHQSYAGKPLIRDFSVTVLRGDRIGVIGPNGAGKSTLLKILLGELTPEQGELSLGTNLEIAYFDQHRSQLDERLNVLDNVAEGREYIELNGQRKHIIGYLQDFLFTPERARAPITRLSGGERNRLLLAKLFAKPSNLLVMDEPTNDLDVETLELLEERLADYPGTLLLVSHDRAFLDHVVTSTLVLEGAGRIGEYIGGYQDWLRQRPQAAAPTSVGISESATTATTAASPAVKSANNPPLKHKRSYQEQRELAELPARIEQLEADIALHSAAMQREEFFRQSSAAIAAAGQELSALQVALDAAYARWAELDG